MDTPIKKNTTVYVKWRDRIAKEKGWNWSTGNYTVKCSDGTLTYAESES